MKQQKTYLVAVTLTVERVYRVKASSEEDAKNPVLWKDIEEQSEGTEELEYIEEEE